MIRQLQLVTRVTRPQGILRSITSMYRVPFPQLGVGQQRSRCLLGTGQPGDVG